MKRNFIAFLLIGSLAVLPALVNAQSSYNHLQSSDPQQATDSDPAGIVQTSVNPPQTPDVPNDIPIDGGLSLLLAAGVGYGAKKAYDKKKKSNK